MIAVIKTNVKKTEYNVESEEALNELVEHISLTEDIRDINVYDDSFTDDLTESFECIKKIFPM